MVRVRSFLSSISALGVALLIALGAATAAAAQAPVTTPPLPPVSSAPGVVAPATPAAANPTPAPALTLSDGYVIGVGDLIEVTVLGRAEYATRVQVQVDGTIQLPYINTLTAANKTVLQLRDEVKGLLTAGGYYANPAVNVAVASYASRYVVVLGDVASPGIVPVDRAYRVSEILARVGGARESGSDTLTLRRATGEELLLPIAKIAVGDTNDDPIVNPGDKLYVPTAPTFYIYGQIGAPGTYRVATGMTMRMALARGGGLTDRGSERRIKVFRDGTELSKFNPSDPIRGGDVIMVGERFF